MSCLGNIDETGRVSARQLMTTRRLRWRLRGVGMAAALMLLGATGRADSYCPTAYSHAYGAMYNDTCFRDDSLMEWAQVVQESPPPLRVATFERVLAVPTGAIDVFGNRVVTVEDDGRVMAVWVLTDKAQTKLPLPVPPENNLELSLEWGEARFDRKDGSLYFHGTGSCCDMVQHWLWQWQDGWVLKSQMGESTGAQKPFYDDLLSRTPKGPLPKSLPIMDGRRGAPEVREDGRGRLWHIGSRGAFLHHDASWRLVVGTPPAPQAIAAWGKSEVWLSSPHGLYRGKLLKKPESLERSSLAKLPPSPKGQPTPGALLPQLESRVVQVEQMSLPVVGGEPLSKATSVSLGSDGSLLFLDGKRLVTYKQGRAVSRMLTDVPRSLQPLASATTGAWLLDREKLLTVAGPSAGKVAGAAKIASADAPIFAPNAIASAGKTSWIASCREPDTNAVVAKHDGSQWRDVQGIPPACYQAVSATADGTAWLAGGVLSPLYPPWPDGAGVLARVGASGTQMYRVAEGALLAVAAMSPNNVWAGGYDGLLVHQQGEKRTTYRVQDDPWILDLAARPGQAVRPGQAAQHEEVAIVGEALVGVIRGGRLHRVPARLLPAGTWRSVVFDSEGALWAVGEPGILRIRYR